ncbi:MAG: ATP synthase F1 subunit gamma [Bacteroidales bacterium]|nr:ATP synthase F1 subunit gamma [Bacteroidales bacterium]
MANLKEVRNRIASVKSTKQITSAMKLVAAAKLRRAQDAIIKMRPYASKLHEILSDLSATMEDSNEDVYSKQRDLNSVLLIVITSNRGLCGAFNVNVVKQAVKLLQTELAPLHADQKVSVVCYGKKGADLFKSKGIPVKEVNIDIFNQLDFAHAAPMAEGLMKDFENGSYDKIILIYNRFKNAAVQIMETEQFLPVEQKAEVVNQPHKRSPNYLFEPGKEEILTELIPKTLKIQLYKALLDSYAAEHGARMTAMHQATENATDLIKELNLTYNKARQAAITKEILEIVSGAEALRG